MKRNDIDKKIDELFSNNCTIGELIETLAKESNGRPYQEVFDSMVRDHELHFGKMSLDRRVNDDYWPRCIFRKSGECTNNHQNRHHTCNDKLEREDCEYKYIMMDLEPATEEGVMHHDY